MKKRTGWLITLGVLALLAFALVTLPAAILGGPLRKLGLDAVGYAGSIWSGHATGFAWRGAALGDLDWTLKPLALLQGRLAGHARLVRSDGGLESDFAVSFGGHVIEVHNADIALPIAALNSLPLGMPKGWQGQVRGKLDELRVENQWPTALRGMIDLDGLVAPPPRNAAVGSFRAVFPHPHPQPALSVPRDPSNLTAKVVDKDGPFSVDAQLTLGRNRAFSLDGTLQPRGSVPESMQRSLELLGPADASGRRQFSVGGTL